MLLGLLLNSLFGWWSLDPIAGLVIACFAVREVARILRPHRQGSSGRAE
ncbi:MAG TPA: hypothetical protein VHZ98_04900 [Galbitalea sp.]|nr:hypothetical protein [Galbitalea sp.]